MNNYEALTPTLENRLARAIEQLEKVTRDWVASEARAQELEKLLDALLDAPVFGLVDTREFYEAATFLKRDDCGTYRPTTPCGLVGLQQRTA